MELKKLDEPVAIIAGNLVLWVDTVSGWGFVVDPKDVIAYIIDERLHIWKFNNS